MLHDSWEKCRAVSLWSDPKGMKFLLHVAKQHAVSTDHSIHRSNVSINERKSCLYTVVLKKNNKATSHGLETRGRATSLREGHEFISQ